MKIQYSPLHVFNRLEEHESLPEEEKKQKTEDTIHELRSDISNAIGVFSLLDKDMQALTENQQREFRYFGRKLESMYKHISELVEKFTGTSNGKPSIINNAVRATKKLAQRANIRERLENHGEIPINMEELLDALQIATNATLYAHNIQFSPNFQRESYLFHRDANQYHINVFSANKHIRLDIETRARFESEADIFSYGVKPLISNAKQHAFNPERDIYARSKEDFQKTITILTKAQEAEKTITIQVSDNGFGITPGIEEKLFQKGASEKTDTRTKHGIGLWGVKQFVENELQGKLGYVTKLGQGTTFSLEVPYKSSTSGIYKL